MTEEKEEAPKAKKTEEAYVMKEVVTQTDVGIGKAGNDEAFTEKGVLLEILNKLDRIEKAVI